MWKLHSHAGPHAQTGPVFGFMLGRHQLEILNNFLKSRFFENLCSISQMGSLFPKEMGKIGKRKR